MIKEINVTLDYLKAVSGKFDIETIFNLNLSEKNIQKLNAIIKCKSLVFLNLSKNRINSLSGIENLKEILYLDISFNNLSNIDGLENLTKMKHLKLAGNKIEYSIKEFEKFKTLCNITKLFFQEISHSEATANPICRLTDYRKEMFRILPSLRTLDGMKKDIDCFSRKQNLSEINEVKMNLEDFNFNFKESI
jgi:hypothetical protein